METMDFMDPKRRRRYNIMLFVGYGLIGFALLLLTVILLFVAYGFGYQNGQVIQNGLLFLSSTPNPAQIYVDGKQYKSDTNTKLVLPSGTYDFVLKRSGYRDWERSIAIDGGAVQTYAYPFFFPDNLTTNTQRDYAAAPALVAQSPDRRWLLVSRPNSLTSFDLYDLSNPKKAPSTVDLPDALLTSATSSQALQLVEWSDDNVHVLLRHAYDGKTEYILLNRSSPDQSLNLSRTLALPAADNELQLSNRRYDQYIIYDAVNHQLSRASLSAPASQLYFSNVLAFSTYGDTMVLFATPDPVDPATVDIDVNDGNATYVIRHDKAATTYLLDLATYGGDMYMAVSASSENVAYVYKNPISQISSQRLGVAVPASVMSVKSPDYVDFSATAQYILFANKTNAAVYDAENDQSFEYALPDTMDAPQAHLNWMDGARLIYVSHGQVIVSDYDGKNRQVLISADPRYGFYFDQSYKTMYAFVGAASNKSHELLTSTSLRTPADQ